MQAAAIATPMAPTTIMPAPAAGHTADVASTPEPSDFARELNLASAGGEPEPAAANATPSDTESTNTETPASQPIDWAALLAGLQWKPLEKTEPAAEAGSKALGDEEDFATTLPVDGIAVAQALPIIAPAVAALPIPQPQAAPGVASLAGAPVSARHTAQLGTSTMADDAAQTAAPSREPADPLPAAIKRGVLASELVPTQPSITFEMTNSATPLSMVSSAHFAAAPSAAAPATPFHAALTAALDSPDFAPALATQVSMLVRDGIGEARLHLHPTELGPIAVQIELDGRRAQVNMSAEHPLTRQALEQALPLLASAMREAGLTLSGGGVFQQPHRDGQNAPRGQARPGVELADADQLPEPRVRVQRGAVDLYA